MTEFVIWYVFKVTLPWGGRFSVYSASSVLLWYSICVDLQNWSSGGKKVKIQRGRSDEVMVSGLNSCQNRDQARFFQEEHL